MAAMARNFAAFRQQQKSGESDGSRTTASPNGTKVTLRVSGDELCVAASGGEACGLVSEATTTPVVLHVVKTDGSRTVLYGPASDDVATVIATTAQGRQVSAKPSGNVFSLAIDGQMQELEMTDSNGRKRKVVGG